MSDTGGGVWGQPCREHFLYGGTGITNFQEQMRPAYVEAVRRYDRGNSLRVAKKSFGRGNQNYGGSLHWADSGDRHDLGDFWTLFDSIKREMKLK